MTKLTLELNANMTKTPLTLISFDLDNTLWSTHRVIGRAERRLRLWLEREHPQATERGLSVANVRELRAQVLTHNPALMNQATNLRLAVLKTGFLQSGYASEQATDAAQQAFSVFIQARNQVSFFPQAIEVLTTLSRAYRLVAITNGNADLDRIGISYLFAAQYNAETVGYAKPAPEIYQHMLTQQRVSPELCLHIGDNPEEDILPAKACGLHTLWSNLTRESWPSVHPNPTLSIQHLAQIPPLITEYFSPHEHTSTTARNLA